MEVWIFIGLAFTYVAVAVYKLYLNQWLQIRWRRWLTQHYLGEWLEGATHYRMRDRLADREIGDAGFGDDHAVVEIDLADALELAKAQQHAVLKRQRAA